MTEGKGKQFWESEAEAALIGWPVARTWAACCIAEVIAAGTDSSLSTEAATAVLEAATLLVQSSANGKPAIDVAGNGRYARQLVEAGEQTRDMRLARSTDIESLDVAQLSEISGADMAAAITSVHSRLNISG